MRVVHAGSVLTASDPVKRLGGLVVADELGAAVDGGIVEISERGQRTAIVRGRGWLVRRLLLLADLVGLLLAMLLAEWFVNHRNNVGVLGTKSEVISFIASLPGWVLVAKLYGLYDKDEERTDHSTVDEFASVFHMVTVCSWAFFAAAYVTRLAHPTPLKLLIFWAAAVVLVTFARAAARSIARRNVAYLQNTIIVGAGDVGQLVARKLLQHPEYCINLVGFVDANPKERGADLGHLAHLGGVGQLPALVDAFDVERVIIAFSNERHEPMLELIHTLKDLDVQIDIVPRFFETLGPNVDVHMVGGLPLLVIPSLDISRSSALLKRMMDLLLSVAALLLLAPLLALIAFAIKLDSSGPVIYRHERVGRHRRPVDVLKFRTMRLASCRGDRYGGDEAEAEFLDLLTDPARASEFEQKYKLSDDPRVTRVGRFLRRTSLDELPQLVNVVKGDLSLVGPRAVTAAELERYGTAVDALLRLRPGITGYWQVNGRSRLDYHERVRLDLLYILGWSLGLDLTILAKTFGVLFRRADAG